MATSMNLSEDVLVEILLRLPVKFLARFTCVCKMWCDLIKGPSFIDMHLNLAERDEYILIQRFNIQQRKSLFSLHSNDESLAVLDPNLEVPGFKSCVCIAASCNGIVCLTDLNAIGLYNPALGEFTMLPPRPFGCPPDLHLSTEEVGFGYDPVTKDYKVVRIVGFHVRDSEDYIRLRDFDSNANKVEVYNLSSNSWRELDGISISVAGFPCFALLFNGSFYWASHKRWRAYAILCFHMGNEVFQEMPFPEGCSGSGQTPSLVVLDESLAFMLYTEHIWAQEQFFDVWIMTEYGWNKKYRIGPLSDIKKPICSWKNDFHLLLESADGQLVSCGVLNNQQRKYDIKGHPPQTLGVVNFKESLVSIRRILEQNL